MSVENPWAPETLQKTTNTSNSWWQAFNTPGRGEVYLGTLALRGWIFKLKIPKYHHYDNVSTLWANFRKRFAAWCTYQNSPGWRWWWRSEWGRWPNCGQCHYRPRSIVWVGTAAARFLGPRRSSATRSTDFHGNNFRSGLQGGLFFCYRHARFDLFSFLAIYIVYLPNALI